MTFNVWLLYLLAATGLSLTPGPNGLLSIAHGLRFGLARTIPTIMGGVCGFMMLVAASLAGLGALLAASEQGFTIAKWVGAAYLAWLGIKTWRSPAPSWGEFDSPQQDIPSAIARFAQGFLVAASNPKALIFFAAFLPQFMSPGTSYWMQLLILGGTFAVVEFIYELMLVVCAQRIAPWLGRNGRWFNRIAGATFIGIAGLMATAQRVSR